MGKKKRHGSRSMTLPMAVIVPVAVLGYNAAKSMAAGHSDDVVEAFTGMRSGQPWSPNRMIANLGPIAVGFGVHWLAGKIGVNRMLGRAKVPLIRI
jgi:hypothetical protein